MVGDTILMRSVIINVTAQSELSLQGNFTIECWTYIDTNVSNGKQISSLEYYINVG